MTTVLAIWAILGPIAGFVTGYLVRRKNDHDPNVGPVKL